MRSIARSCLRNGWREFSARLFLQRPVSCRSRIAKLPGRSAARTEAIRHHFLGATTPLQEFQLNLLVARLRRRAFEHFALVANSPPKLVLLIVDPHEDLVQMPLPVRVRWSPFDAVSPEHRSKHQAKSVSPEPHRLVTDLDAALVSQILHVPQRKQESNIEHRRQVDNLGA